MKRNLKNRKFVQLFSFHLVRKLQRVSLPKALHYSIKTLLKRLSLTNYIKGIAEARVTCEWNLLNWIPTRSEYDIREFTKRTFHWNFALLTSGDRHNTDRFYIYCQSLKKSLILVFWYHDATGNKKLNLWGS